MIEKRRTVSIAALLLATSGPTHVATEQQVLAAVAQSDCVLHMQVTHVAECPTARSGIATVYQGLEYDVKHVLWGEKGVGRNRACFPKYGDCFEGEVGSEWIVAVRRDPHGRTDCGDKIVEAYPVNALNAQVFDRILRDCGSAGALVADTPVSDDSDPNRPLPQGPAVDLRKEGRGLVLGAEFFEAFLGTPYELQEVAYSPGRAYVAFSASNGRQRRAFVGQLGVLCPPTELIGYSNYGRVGDEKVWPEGWPRALTWLDDSELAFLDGFPKEASQPYVFTRRFPGLQTRAIVAGESYEKLAVEGGRLYGVRPSGQRVEVDLRDGR